MLTHDCTLHCQFYPEARASLNITAKISSKPTSTQLLGFNESISYMRWTPIDYVQRLVIMRRISPARASRLTPIGCELCSEPAPIEVLVDVDTVTRIHRVCEECANKAEF